MGPADDELKVLRVSSSAGTNRKDVEAFREMFGRAILRIDMQPLRAAPLQADMVLRAFAGFGMATGALSPMRNRHELRLVDNDDLVLVVMQGGHGTLEQHGRRTDISAGQVVLTSNGEAATFTGHTATRVINLRFGRAQLAPQLANLGDALVDAVVPDSTALRLLKSYVSFLAGEQALATPSLRHAVATHMQDLAALSIGATREIVEVAIGRGLRAARLSAVKADILANLGDPHLSLTSVAARQGISPRYVRRLMEGLATSFSEYVVSLRLDRARQLLIDPHNLTSTISAIAFDCGFSDLSYFNRTFRRRYGATPTETRAEALRR